VAQHLVAVGRLIDEDPATALAHALAARRLASRIGAVREAVGLAAYHAGQWQTAIAELRTFHRMSGRQAHLAVLADCERALGRPERAIDLYRSAAPAALPAGEATELLIVVAGARADLGQHDAAVAMLQVPELSAEQPSLPVARLRYAYADALLAAGRRAEAREWFARAAVADEDTQTDAAQRLLDLDGVILEEAAAEPAEPDEPVAESPAPAPDGLIAEPVAEPVAGRAAGDAATPADEPGTTGPTGRLVDAYDLVILDLDGVVYLGDQPVPGATAAVARLRREGPPVVFVTNNASRSPGEVAGRLAELGMEAAPEEVLTSAGVAADQLADRLAPGSAVLVVGSEALAGEVRRAGLQPVRAAEDKPAAVVQGYAPRVGWAELAEAGLAIQAGAAWVVTNLDPTLPSPRGPLPGNGALVAALATALGREPDLVVGKPEPALFTTAARRAGAVAPLVVGDRLDTDIAGAHRAGMDSLLVLTGVTDLAQARTATGERRPSHLGTDLDALFAPPAPPPPSLEAAA
jgi:HAD superfamily hydrolase (TIGR01450 family)